MASFAGDGKGHRDHRRRRQLFELLRDCVGWVRASEEGRAIGARHARVRADRANSGPGSPSRARSSSCPSGTSIFPGRAGLKDGYKALTARPFLPRYFPGFDLYFWIDADCWVQQGDAIALFLRAARTGALAAAPEIHRSMRHYITPGRNSRRSTARPTLQLSARRPPTV